MQKRVNPFRVKGFRTQRLSSLDIAELVVEEINGGWRAAAGIKRTYKCVGVGFDCAQLVGRKCNLKVIGKAAEALPMQHVGIAEAANPEFAPQGLKRLARLRVKSAGP